MCKITPCMNGGAVYQDGMCLFHWKLAGSPKPEKKQKPIPKVSKTRKEELAEYHAEAAKYKKEHTECELKLPGCSKKTEDIHHTRGKEGKRLLDKKHWKTCCRPCHQKVTENSSEAIKNKHSVSRIKKAS